MTKESSVWRPPAFHLALVLGGARSGKSALAERMCSSGGLTKICIATAEALDAEMAERIARHRAVRGPDWETIEAPRALVEALHAADAPGRVILVDCLTLWLSNVILAGDDPEAAGAHLCAVVGDMRARVTMVSNEVGLGLVPETPLGRSFRDAQGRLNQRMAATADLVVFAAAGLPLILKSPGP
jgi:adenosylcobinamide kinase/adenosylcobinamide-phosphate guanylyltransferase